MSKIFLSILTLKISEHLMYTKKIFETKKLLDIVQRWALHDPWGPFDGCLKCLDILPDKRLLSTSQKRVYHDSWYGFKLKTKWDLIRFFAHWNSQSFPQEKLDICFGVLSISHYWYFLLIYCFWSSGRFLRGIMQIDFLSLTLILD